MPPKPKPMQLTQALSLLADLAEFELISPACPDPPPAWRYELEQATRVTRRWLASQREPSGEFFTAAKDSTKRRLCQGGQ